MKNPSKPVRLFDINFSDYPKKTFCAISTMYIDHKIVNVSNY